MIKKLAICIMMCTTALSESPATDRKTINYRGGSITFVATPEETVRDMLWMARVKPDDIVYDLGSGDGRIAIAAARDFGVTRAVGIENDPTLVEKSREAAEDAGVSDRVSFIEGDMFASDFSEATVVTVFVGHGPNIALRPQLFRQLKPSARIVSSQSGMGEWKPNSELTTFQAHVGMWGTIEGPFDGIRDVPSYSEEKYSYNTKSRLFSWAIPTAIAGDWLVEVQSAQGARQVRISLDQQLSEASGTFQVLNDPEIHGRVQCRVWGTEVTWECIPEGFGYLAFNVRFEGNASNDTMSGKLRLIEGDHKWETQTSIVRASGSVIGTWHCLHPADQRPMRLQVIKEGEGLKATLFDHEKPLELTDFYDFGGGFYFTYLFSSDGRDRPLAEDSGWLIGKAHVGGDALGGELRYYAPNNWLTGYDPSNNGKPKTQPWSTSRAVPAAKRSNVGVFQSILKSEPGSVGLDWSSVPNPQRINAIPLR